MTKISTIIPWMYLDSWNCLFLQNNTMLWCHKVTASR